MRINKYNEYITESILIQLINESEVVFKKDFKELLDDMQTGFNDSVDKICNILIDIVKSNRDLDVVQNYIGLSDEIDKVSFIPDNKVNDLDIKVTGNIIGIGLKNELHSIQKDAKLPLEGMLFLPSNEFMENDIINSWKIAKKINMALVPDTNWNQYTLYYLQNTEDLTKFTTVYSHVDDIGLPFEYIDNGVNKIKIGRYINKLLDLYFSSNPDERKKYTNSDIEAFTNKFISAMEYKRNALDHFKIVKGEDIKYWYLVDNYVGRTGQLGQSCMRHSICQDFFKIYIDNPDVCQLVIFTDTRDKLLGRALLWTLEDGNLYMDRIYTTRDSSTELFRKWGNLNGYRKQYPNSNELKVKIPAKSYELYPYMDTFKYYKPEEGLLANRMLETPYLELQEDNGQAERRIN